MELDGLPSTVMQLPAVTLTFDLLTQKPDQYVSWSRYVCDLILVKLAPIVTNILYSPCFSGHCPVTLIFDLLTPNLISISKPNNL